VSEKKGRVILTLDAELVRSGNAAVRAGQAASLSEWVNTALLAHVAEAKRRASARRAQAAYDRAFGAMTPAEVGRRVASLRKSAVRVRAKKTKEPRRAR
jgi:hypothetical protein